MAASALVAVGDDAVDRRPLRLVGTRLYLDRYWREERQVAADLRALAGRVAAVDEAVLGRRARAPVRAPTDARPQAAPRAEAAVRRRLAVVAGGPGTGKTTTVARIVALLVEQAGGTTPLIALAAPTGKAAARLRRRSTTRRERSTSRRACASGCSGCARRRCTACSAGGPTATAASATTARNRLPHDVVIVDETSMVSLSLMARLVEAVRPDARLVLVGDPGQLASIEAGAVLGDVVGRGRPRASVVARPRPPLGRAIAALADGDPRAATPTRRSRRLRRRPSRT